MVMLVFLSHINIYIFEIVNTYNIYIVQMNDTKSLKLIQFSCCWRHSEPFSSARCVWARFKLIHQHLLNDTKTIRHLCEYFFFSFRWMSKSISLLISTKRINVYVSAPHPTRQNMCAMMWNLVETTDHINKNAIAINKKWNQKKKIEEDKN